MQRQTTAALVRVEMAWTLRFVLAMKSRRSLNWRNPDVIVIGGGVVGLTVGRRLSQEGARVLLLEKAEVGAEASSAAAGMISPYFEAAAPGALFELCRWSAGLYPEFVRGLAEETKLELDYRAEATLCVALSSAESRDLEARLGWQVEAGLPVRWLDPAAARALVPGLAPGLVRAALLEGDHRVNSRRLVRALRASCERMGLRIREKSPVTEILSGSGEVRGVRAGGRTHRAPRVLLAAGSWSGDLDLGEGKPALPVSPVRGQMASLRLPEKLDLNRVVHGPGCYLVPQDAVNVWVGATMEREGFVKEVTASGLAKLLDAARRLLPGLGKAALVESWSGLRPESPDGLPILGETMVKGLFAATGHFRKGILLAPATASLMADLILGKHPGLDLDAFSPRRFLGEPAFA